MGDVEKAALAVSGGDRIWLGYRGSGWRAEVDQLAS